MIRGTTPTHQFTLSFDTDRLRCVRIIYAQNDEIVLAKDTDDCTLDGPTITVTLSQEETFRFDCKEFAQIQVRVLTRANESLVSPIIKEKIEKCLDSEVMV